MPLKAMHQSRTVEDANCGVFEGSRDDGIVRNDPESSGCAPVCGDLPLCLELQAARCPLSVKAELDEEVVVDVAGKETALVNADGRGNVLFLCVLGLIDEGVLGFCLHPSLLEL